MPPICIHLVIAREAAQQLQHPIIDQNLGSYLVGATFPDVHIIIADSRRERTHFLELGSEDFASGAVIMLQTHPRLTQRGRLDSSTQSFVAGYLSHLVTDEVWILDIYRPCFGTSSLLSHDPMANMLDRLLQFELDCREREDRTKMEEIQALICDWEPKVEVDFIDAAALKQWRDFVCIAAGREPSLAFFPAFARRFLLPKQKVNPEELEQFFSSMPAKLKWAIQYVTPERLTAFRQKAIIQSVAVARGYLGEDS
jgi:hypothetical protein